jgi:CheY-like chemotaxis protein
MSEQTGNPVFEGEVLLCEDNRMNREVVCGRLAKAGLKTVEAENGRDGVAAVASRAQSGLKPFDLIFMDIHMPVMGGLEAAAEIRKLNTGTPVIALTPNTSPADREQYTAHGMCGCLNKPFTRRELSDCLSEHLKPLPPGTAVDDTQDTQDETNLKNKLIYLFVKNNKTLYAEITKAIDEGDIKLAHRLVHTLKSNAGMLGKTRLQKAAEDAENLLSNEENRITGSVTDTLKAELDAALEEFGPLAEKAACEDGGEAVPSPREAGGTNDAEKTQALFEELEALLDGGDTDCLDLIGSLRLIPGTGELIRQIEFFEFDAAAETLRQMRSTKI